MATHTLLQVAATSLLLASILNFSLCYSGQYDVIKKMPLRQLENNLNFILARPELANVDCIYGIVLAEAQLEIALTKLLDSHSSANLLERYLHYLKDKCIQIRELATLSWTFSSRSVSKIAETVLDPTLWQNSITNKDGGFDNLPQLNWTKQQIEESITYGQPNETQSDFCIENSLDNYDPNTRLRSSTCVIDTSCRLMMVTGEVHGYPLTHRLLYFMIIKRTGCSEAFEINVEGAEEALCGLIYAETMASFVTAVPYMARDLFMEQIVLCGLEGFSDFLQQRFLDLVLTWQDPHGCFGAYTHRQSQRGNHSGRREKRESLRMPYGCHSHITGLAASMMALFIRSLTEQLVEQNTYDP